MLPWLSSSSAPSLSIVFSERDKNVFFLYPTPADLQPIGDTIITGRVILNLPIARKVKCVQVEMLGVQSFRFRGKEHSLETIRRNFRVDIAEAELPAGEHAFAFSINVPANVAPSSCDFGATDYKVSARIPKLGRLGGDLETSRNIVLFVNHSGHYNGLPPSHHSETQFLHHRFGPTSVEFSSKHLIIGGFLRWYIRWTAFTLPFRIVDLTVEIVQHIRIRPAFDVTNPVEVHETRNTIYSKREDPTWTSRLNGILRPGVDLPSITRQSRLPYDKGPLLREPGPQLMSSHHPDSQSCIQASAEIVLNLLFEQYEGGENPTAEQLSRGRLQEMQIKSPATLSSCFCRLEYYNLPAYGDGKEWSEQNSDHKSMRVEAELPKGPYGYPQCMCKELGQDEEREYGQPWEEVIKIRNEQETASRAWLEVVRVKADSNDT